MESASQSDQPPQPHLGKTANLLGTLVAFLTLVLPFIMVAYFSAQDLEVPVRSQYPLSRLE